MPGIVRVLGALLADADTTDDAPDEDTDNARQQPANATDTNQRAGPNTEGDGQASSETDIGLEQVFDAIPRPAFLVDDEHTVLAYNTGLNRLLGLPDDHRAFLGGDNRETIAAATYTDGRRHRSLVDKIVENPFDAEDHWEVDRIDDGIMYTDCPVYEDTSVSKTADGEEVHIGFLAVPILNGDELIGVFELVEDRSDEIRHQQAVAALVSEVTATLDAIGNGDLSARASFEDEAGVLDPALLDLTTAVNDMAADFEGLVDGVDTRTSTLSESIELTHESIGRIDRQADAQSESLRSVVNEMQDFSATMEEVAASSNQVTAAADDALTEAKAGLDVGADARSATAEVLDISEALTETVQGLDRYMTEVQDVVEVISDVAEQTNMLALNANIEAARVDQDGDGFAVVADEVKALAVETREQTDEIADRIDAIQSHSDETVELAARSHDHLQDVAVAIEEVVASFETIAEATEAASTGIQNVADANDEQAETVEAVVNTVEEVQAGAAEISETTETVVTETDRQAKAVTALADRVEHLSTDP